MADPATRKRALEILANPLTNEKEWLGAIAILGGKVPAPDHKRLSRKFVRFLKRTTGLSIMYTVVLSLYGAIFLGSGFYWGMIPIAFLWAGLEVSFGAFTILALAVMITNLGSILSLSPSYQSTWIVILLNLFAYKHWNWRPYVFVPVRYLMRKSHNRVNGNAKLLY